MSLPVFTVSVFFFQGDAGDPGEHGAKGVKGEGGPPGLAGERVRLTLHSIPLLPLPFNCVIRLRKLSLRIQAARAPQILKATSSAFLCC